MYLWFKWNFTVCNTYSEWCLSLALFDFILDVERKFKKNQELTGTMTSSPTWTITSDFWIFPTTSLQIQHLEHIRIIITRAMKCTTQITTPTKYVHFLVNDTSCMEITPLRQFTLNKYFDFCSDQFRIFWCKKKLSLKSCRKINLYIALILNHLSLSVWQ